MRREAAESAMKDTFIGIASHELRTPLTAMKLQLELLGRDLQKGTPAGRIEMLHRGLARMDSLVDELLSLSAIKTGTLSLRRERGDLASICRTAAEEQMLIAHRDVSIDVPTEPTIAFVDAPRVQQVLGNLLSNALKYSPPDRPVALHLRMAEGEAIIDVRDEGPGIPAEALPHLFERFYRVPGTEARAGSRVGLGLGLFIAHAIVSRHGGRIEVETAPGRGSTFSVRLPLGDSTSAAQA
jgi:signal transduction histidine kinase